MKHIKQLKEKREEYGVSQLRFAVACVDYFRVRFPITDALAVILDVLQLKPDYMFFF